MVMGTSFGSPRLAMHEHAEKLAEHVGAKGPRLTVSTACTSSTNAIGLGCDLLRTGVADLVLAGGSDVLTPEMFAGFHALGVLCPERCAPFSEPAGMTLGEGAGFMVLERAGDAALRGARAEIEILGYGLSADAFHETSPDPSGAGVARAMRAALADAGLSPSDVGYVNAHGTGTSANDPAEWRALERVFGAPVATSSSKGHLGHAQGAAGVLEALVTALALPRQVLPPTAHFSRRRRGCPVDPVAQERPRPTNYRRALSTNSAFGGANASVVLGAPTEPASRAEELGPRIPHIVGLGAVGAHGHTLDAFEEVVASGRPLGGKVPAFELNDLVPRVDTRNLDPSARFLTAAAASAVADAGLRIHGELRDKIGIIAGISRLSAVSSEAFWGSIERHGLPRISASAFARMMLNAAAGSCSLALQLRGPITTITGGRGSGLLALAHAADSIERRADADFLLAGAVDELASELPAEDAGEGAACVLLGATSGGGAAIRVAGWGIAGPTSLRAAVAAALTKARLTPEEIDIVAGALPPDMGDLVSRQATTDPCVSLGVAEATGSLWSVIAAAGSLRRGRGRAALVVATSTAVSCAIVLTSEGSSSWTQS